MFARHYSELKIYQLSIQLNQEVSELVKTISYYWRVREVIQILNSSDSVSSNIVEGFSNRFYFNKFHHYLNIALGSSDETQKHLIALYRHKYISETDLNHYLSEYKCLSIKILNFINYLRRRNESLHNVAH